MVALIAYDQGIFQSIGRHRANRPCRRFHYATAFPLVDRNNLPVRSRKPLPCPPQSHPPKRTHSSRRHSRSDGRNKTRKLCLGRLAEKLSPKSDSKSPRNHTEHSPGVVRATRDQAKQRRIAVDRIRPRSRVLRLSFSEWCRRDSSSMAHGLLPRKNREHSYPRLSFAAYARVLRRHLSERGCRQSAHTWRAS